MKKVACLYFEGNDSKLSIFEVDNKEIKLTKAVSIESSQAFVSRQNLAGNKDSNANNDVIYYDTLEEDVQAQNNAYIQKLNKFLKDEKLKDLEFIPILTEPGLSFQKIESKKDLEILTKSGKKKKKDRITSGVIELADKSNIAIFPSGQINYLQALNTLSKSNGLKFLKLAGVKCAETALVNYITSIHDLKGEDNSLIVYFGKEYTKLIFLKGKNIVHFGSTISVGKNHGKIANVVVSKILFEREHAQLEKPKNIFIYGEEVSNDLTKKLKESYIGSKVYNFELNPTFSANGLSNDKSLQNYSIPIAAIYEHIIADAKTSRLIDLLPHHIREQQKKFQLAWHGFILLLALFLTVFFATNYVLNTESEIKKMETEIGSLLAVQRANLATVEKINNMNTKVNRAEQTKKFLDDISSGTGQWLTNMEKLSEFTGEYKNLWLNKIKISNTNPIEIGGFSTRRYILPRLKRSYDYSSLEFMHYQPMRDRNVYEFNLKISNISDTKNEPKN